MNATNLLSTLLIGSALVYGVGCSNQMDAKKELAVSLSAIKGDVSSKTSIDYSREYFISADSLSVWSAPNREPGNLLGYLKENDVVRVVKNDSELPSTYIEVEVIKSFETLKTSEKLFISYSYISTTEVKAREPSPYFMIQNIASEKIRVYKKICLDGSCPHQLVLETDLLAGEKTRKQDTMTSVGSYNIIRWQKFYETSHYPSWFRSDLPLPPAPGASGTKWFKKKYTGMKGGMRGAFGWYTAKVGPNAAGQWTHGTIGWGEDKRDFLERSKGFFLNLIADPRSHGCSRTDNESIAYIRELMEVGAEIVKIYAIEGILDETMSQYDETQKTVNWNYILTKNGRMKDGQKSDKMSVLADNTDPADFIEEGVYVVDQFPDAVEFQAKDAKCKDREGEVIEDVTASRGLCEYRPSHFKIKNNYGNSYALRKAEMNGVFYVDAGMVKGYGHPKSLPRGGKRNEVVPKFMITK